MPRGHGDSDQRIRNKTNSTWVETRNFGSGAVGDLSRTVYGSVKRLEGKVWKRWNENVLGGGR